MPVIIEHPPNPTTGEGKVKLTTTNVEDKGTFDSSKGPAVVLPDNSTIVTSVDESEQQEKSGKKTPVCFRKNPELIRDALSSDELAKMCFSQPPLSSTTVRTGFEEEEKEIPSTNSNTVNIPTSNSIADEHLRSPCIISLSSASSTSSRDSNDVHHATTSPSDLAAINNKIVGMTTARQGRSTQRWDVNKKTNECIRLVTGCVPILKGGRILFVTASRKGEWILPKGGWEMDEPMEESALRETFEEAGVLGKLGPVLSPVEYETRKSKKRRLERVVEEEQQQQKSSDDREKKDSSNNATATMKVKGEKAKAEYSFCRLQLFPLFVTEVKEKWPESGRLRKVVNIDDAIVMLQSRPEFHAALVQVKERGLHLLDDPAKELFPDQEEEIDNSKNNSEKVATAKSDSNKDQPQEVIR